MFDQRKASCVESQMRKVFPFQKGKHRFTFYVITLRFLTPGDPVWYDDLDFQVFELVQLNTFMNHLFAHNTIFVYVEKNLVND